MNETCQLKSENISSETIHIRGDALKTDNTRRTIPIHPKLISLGLLNWVNKCNKNRLFHEWKPVKGSYSQAGSRWFIRNNPFKSNVVGQITDVGFTLLGIQLKVLALLAKMPLKYLVVATVILLMISTVKMLVFPY